MTKEKVKNTLLITTLYTGAFLNYFQLNKGSSNLFLNSPNFISSLKKLTYYTCNGYFGWGLSKNFFDEEQPLYQRLTSAFVIAFLLDAGNNNHLQGLFQGAAGLAFAFIKSEEFDKILNEYLEPLQEENTCLIEDYQGYS